MANNPYVNKVQKADGTTLIDLTTDTAIASDVAQGKYFHLATGERVQGTASGGGGASNIVTGTFKGTTTGAAMDVTLNYTGSGYPIALVIYPKGGIYGNSSFSTLVQRYSCAMFSLSKEYSDTPASYNNTSRADEYVVLTRYKNSSSSSTSYTQTSGIASTANDTNATSTATNIVKFRNKAKMSVFIANSSHGFAANIEYTYHVIYSS